MCYIPPHITGDISSDLYRPQSQDEIVEFSFFVALSYESNLQLGCFWWKISMSSLKTFFFYKFCAYFCKSHVQTWELRFSKIYIIEGWWVKKNALSHSHFHYWLQKAIIFKNRTTFGHSRAFLESIPFPQKHRSHGWTLQLWWW